MTPCLRRGSLVAAAMVAPAAAQPAPPALTPRSLESMPPPSRPWRQTLSLSPLHLAVSMVEITAETSIPQAPRLSFAVTLGVRYDERLPTKRQFGLSFGAAVGYYVLGTFATGIAVGAEGQFSSLDRGDASSPVVALVVGDGVQASLWIGGKWTAPIGAAVTAQLGLAWRRDVDTYEGDTVGPDRVRPVVNLLVGWTL